MNSARTQPTKTERDLFLEALERPTPDEWAAFLEEACAHDTSLRARQYVQLTARALIGVAASDGKFLWRYDRPANRMGKLLNATSP